MAGIGLRCNWESCPKVRRPRKTSLARFALARVYVQARVPRELRIEDGGSRPAFGGGFVNQLAAGQIVVLAHILRQAGVHQDVGPAP